MQCTTLTGLGQDAQDVTSPARMSEESKIIKNIVIAIMWADKETNPSANGKQSVQHSLRNGKQAKPMKNELCVTVTPWRIYTFSDT